ncbi:hypothetical protein, partial [Rhizobium mongolense]|uniref:hypothetical protein n=1 Tax=Rhizobium mongolense TaxID=57676 RepID=UPI0034A37C94
GTICGQLKDHRERIIEFICRSVGGLRSVDLHAAPLQLLENFAGDRVRGKAAGCSERSLFVSV